MLRGILSKLRPRREVEPEHHRAKSQHVSWLTFKEVKHSLKLVGKARGYEDVRAVARMHNIGRTTAYKIKAAASYGDYRGTAKKIMIEARPVKTYQIKVSTNK